MDYDPPLQAVMAFDFVHSHVGNRLGRDVLFVPVGVTALSALILLFHWVLASKVVSRLLVRIGLVDERADTVSDPGIGKSTILVFRVARVTGCLLLLALSILQLLHRREGLLLTVPYLYASILAALSASPKESRHRLIRHVNCVLFLAFCVYAYRDLLPLATFTGVPADLDEGRTLWAKIFVLFITAVMIPLFTPRQYIPVDQLNPAKAVNPELTASVFSFIFFLFLDQITLRAYRESQLHEEELYPLCDTDGSAHLKNRSFKLAPARSLALARLARWLCDLRRHPFWAIIAAPTLPKS
ncbi:hypothetical protein C8R47DRAFT_1285504 [Mycena vitilis]|nr:hypothetical protein C8R47DRAFT_1285504 [Mycena vitilis]